MSQEYFPPSGAGSSSSASASAGEGSSRGNGRNSPASDAPRNVPDYMVVGSGVASESARNLMTTLGADSGYGGSIAGESSSMHDWQAGLMEDKPTPTHTPGVSEAHPAGTYLLLGWILEMANGCF